ncbi:hypothetical protein QJU89_05635 [Pasteurella skyensis]|uniref:Uncharacterized protein n=1 Tax=Phocoenobacter skyensis TaxID=97481 RepID=A0AAJ6NAH6_9PAST|nr:hypothetical protein [Pasteurella skyensis]MDP8162773.1 hypothetical protein [Pasteurella skyensis]MDP8173244.1 hypothetical protein [Pasteurella skyensis]MDP8177539.1 hypothetical protein [Pasteurella skyensis]MDP8178875.1 hypothetical protein [Pasteurella skyensis]MDP8183175.1 hypothetical protein [Pasteurella skyensis]
MAKEKTLEAYIKDGYTPDTIARNIKQLDNDVIEIRRYNDGNLKADGAWIWFIVVLCLMVTSIISDDVIYHDMQWAISPDIRLKPNYEYLQEVYESQGILDELRPYEEFRKGMMEEHGHRRYAGAFFIALPILLFLWVASPKWRPLRIDRRRRLVYFVNFGQLYIDRYPDYARQHHKVMEYLDTDMHQPWIRHPCDGGLRFNLSHAKKPTTRRFSVGIFKPACPFQNHVLKAFLNDYLSTDNPEAYQHYFKKTGRIKTDFINFFYQFTLFPTRGYNEKRTERQIQEWLKKNPEDEHFDYGLLDNRDNK